MQLNLARNPDILAEVAALEQPPFTVGFAAETRELEQHARLKLKQKKIHMIAANQVASSAINGEDMGFNSTYNALDVFWQDGHEQLPRADKNQIARQLLELIAQQYPFKN
jgi:phosphopantothenoylcysteine decarboxylase/phosphopantothenate--cysteine ligase